MALDTFADLVKAVADIKDVFTVGTVKSIDESEMTCVVTPEDEGQDIEDVPLRIMRYADSVGFTIVPVINTEVVVAWLDKHRPLIFRVHEWDELIAQNKEGHGLIIRSGELLLGVESGATHPVAWGDVLATYLNTMRTAITGHGIALDPVPSFNSVEVKTS